MTHKVIIYRLKHYIPHALFFLVCAWLLAAAFSIQIEYDDGYNTIINSQYFLGITNVYSWQRGPVMALLLLPAEYLSNLLDLAFYDVTLHHITTAILHALYLYLTWRWLNQKFSHKTAILLSFIMSMLTYVFYSYAPFISHDLMPGIILLAMLRISSRLPSSKIFYPLLYLTLLGTIAPLIKQTYAIFWVLVLISNTCADIMLKKRVDWLRLGLLSLGACASAVIVWFSYALTTTGAVGFDHVPFWMRPLELTRKVSEHYAPDPLNEIFPWWLYIRNITAYGLGAMLLIIPGIYLSLTSRDRLLIMIAVSWVLSVIVMHLSPFKEVRYLAFLAPLTAFLLAPLTSKLLHQNRRNALYLLALLAIDHITILPEVIDINSTFSQKHIKNFFEPLGDGNDQHPVITTTSTFSFVNPTKSALFADRYHNIHHMSLDVLIYLNHNRKAPMITASPEKIYSEQFAPGFLLTYANATLLRVPPWERNNKVDAIGINSKTNFSQAVAEATVIELIKREDHYYISSPSPKEQFWILVRNKAGTLPPVLTSTTKLPASLVHSLFGDNSNHSHFEVIAFKIITICSKSACYRFE